ncbi:MAG: flagellar filament capping protein FliD [Chromatiaceae bacterium]|nr:flagellar filament capping protein FliD [Chromatiaceae bacterium]MCP5313805.1 flagellar filament capping protein FliD [Chromatiaceae bacterium]
MAITAAGVGSGLDIENIVSQLMSLERRPLVALQQKTNATQTSISSFGNLKSAISSFQDKMQELGSLDAFRKFAVTSSNEEALTASADGDAAAGIYSIDVLRLAQNHKQGSNELNETATVGGGAGDSLTLTVGTGSSTIDLSSARTLTSLRDAINSAADNPGVTATILNTGNGNQRLIVTADESGYDGRVQLSYSSSAIETALGFATTNRDELGDPIGDLAQLDAAYRVDGFDLTASSNRVSDAIDGLTLELKGIGSSTLALERDNEAIEESAKSFVEAYNALLDTINDLRGDELAGDSLLPGIARALRGVLNTAPVGLSGEFSALSQVGIRTNAQSGRLEIDSDDFADALDNDFSAVAQLFANDDQGFAFRFDAMADYYLGTDSPIDSRVDGLNARVRRLGNEESSLEFRLERKEAALRAQYASLDSLIGGLQSTSTFLLQNFFT